jgi:Family of unknown function (DUF6763)
MNALQPEVGQWYRHLDKGEGFVVVDIDDDARTIDVQSYDGDLDEIDRDSWDVMALARMEPPEDWTGPVDDVERDDLGYSDAEVQPPNLMQPPAPLGIEGWDDTRNGAIEVEEDEPATGALVARDRGSRSSSR